MIIDVDSFLSIELTVSIEIADQLFFLFFLLIAVSASFPIVLAHRSQSAGLAADDGSEGG